MHKNFLDKFLRNLLLLLVLSFGFIFDGYAQTGTLEKIRQTGKIVIGHREASIPFSYYDDKKVPIGYAIDICHQLVKVIQKELKLNTLQIEYLMITPATRMQAIADGKIDIECGSTTATNERRKMVEFTIPYYISSARFLVKSDAQVKKLYDLSGKTVVSTTGTTNIKTLQRLNTEQVLRMNLIESKDHAQGFQFVAEGKADAFAMDDVLLYGLRANAAKPSDFKVVGEPMTIEPYAIMLRKGDPDFKKLIDKEIARLITNFEIYPIYKKWFETQIPPKGINLELKMPFLLRDSFKFPSDKLPD